MADAATASARPNFTRCLQNITWLILARAIAGVGGGGIVSLIWTITSEIVDVQNQAKWSQALSFTWAASAVAGPLLGGAFSGESDRRAGTRIPLTALLTLPGSCAEESGPFNWRWACAYIFLPVQKVTWGTTWGSYIRGNDSLHEHPHLCYINFSTMALLAPYVRWTFFGSLMAKLRFDVRFRRTVSGDLLSRYRRTLTRRVTQ